MIGGDRDVGGGDSEEAIGKKVMSNTAIVLPAHRATH